MKTLTSLSSAIALSFVHLLLEMWRGFLDFSLVYPGFARGNTGSLALYGLVYTVMLAAWLLGLAGARQGSRGGIIAAIVFGALFWVGLDWGTVFFYCPGGCSHIVFDITSYVALGVGALALFGLAANLRGGKS